MTTTRTKRPPCDIRSLTALHPFRASRYYLLLRIAAVRIMSKLAERDSTRHGQHFNSVKASCNPLRIALQCKSGGSHLCLENRHRRARTAQAHIPNQWAKLRPQRRPRKADAEGAESPRQAKKQLVWGTPSRCTGFSHICQNRADVGHPLWASGRSSEPGARSSKLAAISASTRQTQCRSRPARPRRRPSRSSGSACLRFS